jgi:hypothetical protein
MALPANGPFTAGIRAAIVAPWNGDGTYGTAVRVPGIKNVNIEAVTVNAEQTGDDRVMAVMSKVVSGNVTMSQARFSFEVMNVINAQPIQSASSFKRQKFTSRKSRYFGLVAHIDEPEGDGELQLFIPQMKLMENLSMNYAYGEFTTPELSVRALLDENYNDEDGYPCLFYVIQVDARQDLAIPPVLALTDES